MTIIDWIMSLPVWGKVLMGVLGAYIFLWLPRVISRLNRIILILYDVNRSADKVAKEARRGSSDVIAPEVLSAYFSDKKTDAAK